MFLTGDRIWLLSFWMISIVVGIVVINYVKNKLHLGILRKMFHALAFIMFLPGIHISVFFYL